MTQEEIGDLLVFSEDYYQPLDEEATIANIWRAVQAALKAAVEGEREACAKLAEQANMSGRVSVTFHAAHYIAEQIRRRGR